MRSTLIAFIFAVAAMMAGCAGGSSSQTLAKYPFPQRSLEPEMIFATPEAPRELRMFNSDSRTRILWDDLEQANIWAEVLLISADPRDPISNQVVTALVRDTSNEYPWTQIALPELDRSDQQIASRYAAGLITIDQLTNQAALSSEAETYWQTARVPLLEIIRGNGGGVVAPALPESIALLLSEGGPDALRNLEEPADEWVEEPETALSDNIVMDYQIATAAQAVTAVLDEMTNPRVIFVHELGEAGVNQLLAEIAERRPETRAITTAVVQSNAENIQLRHVNLADAIIYTNQNPR